MGAVDLAVLGVVFFKAGHALHFCLDKTKMKLRQFRRCALAQVMPVLFEKVLIEFGDLANGNMNIPDALRFLKL